MPSSLSTDTELQLHDLSSKRKCDFEDKEESEDLPSTSKNQADATSFTSTNARSIYSFRYNNTCSFGCTRQNKC